MNRYWLLLLHIISLILLGFGLVYNMLQINISTHILIDLNLFDEKRSVIGTLQSLWNSANYFPFSLIFLFGIMVPIAKSIIIFFIILSKKSQPKWQQIVSIISKWAMADVFAISIFIAFLGAKAMQNTQAKLEKGFYFFAAYVLLSSIAAMFLNKLPQE